LASVQAQSFEHVEMVVYFDLWQSLISHGQVAMDVDQEHLHVSVWNPHLRPASDLPEQKAGI
jgi:hypothetical protein